MSGFNPLPSTPSDHKSSPKSAEENSVQSLMPQFIWAKSKTNSSTYHTGFNTADHAHTFKSKLLQLIKQCGQPLDAVVDRTLRGAYVVSIMGVTEPVLKSLGKESQTQFKALSSEAVMLTDEQVSELIIELNQGNFERCKKILGTITDLGISYIEITPVGIKTLNLVLKENTTLISLNLEFNKIGAEGAKDLADALIKNTTLTALNLRGNNIRAQGPKDLADALIKNTTLVSLNLGGNNIGAEGAKDLADALIKNTTLTSLNLEYNKIGAQGAKYLADALIKNITLMSLILNCNNIGAEGAKDLDLADALIKNTTLTSLELGANSIRDEGAKVLANALIKNTTLRSLNLATNNIGAQGAKDLADALIKNTTLTSLNLKINDIREAGVNYLVEGLNENAILTSLELAGNKNIDSQQVSLVTQSLTRNQAFHPKLDLLQRHLADKLYEFISMPTDLTKIIVAYAGGFNVVMVLSLMLSLVRQSSLQELSSKMPTDIAKLDYTLAANFKILLGLLDELVSREILSRVPHLKSPVEIEVLRDKEDVKAKPSKYDYKNSKQKLSSNSEPAAVSFATAQSFHQQAKPPSAASSAPSSSLSLGRG